MNRTIKAAALVASAALIGSGAAISASATAAHRTTSTKQPGTPTAYAYEASGYSSHLAKGRLPTGSGKLAFQTLACTNRVGLSKTNAQAHTTIAGLALAGARTHTWTSGKGDAQSSWAENSVARVTLVKTVAGTLFLKGVDAVAHVWHDQNGFHSRTTADVAKIGLRLPGGRVVTLKLNAHGRLHVPGIATIQLARGERTHGEHGATAVTDAVKIKLRLTHSTVYVAHARATISDGVTQHLFSGYGYASKVDVLKHRLGTGPTPLLLMPCPGTNGDVNERSIAHADLGRGIHATALRTSERTTGSGAAADATVRASIGTVRLGHGLVVKAVVAKAHAYATASGVRTDAKGTKLARVYLNGTRIRLHGRGVVRIAHIAKLEPRVIERSDGKIDVTALRVTLLDGRLATVDLGRAVVGIRSSGLS